MENNQVLQPQQTSASASMSGSLNNENIQQKPSKLPTIFLIIISLASISGLVFLYLQNQSLKKQVTDFANGATQQNIKPAETLKAPELLMTSYDPNQTTFVVDMNMHKFAIEAPKTWKVEGLFEENYQNIYKDALVKDSVAFPVLSISDPKLGTNPVYRELPFNALIITANKGSFAESKLKEFTSGQYKESMKVDYFPGYEVYEVKSIEKENPADWMEDSTPPPLKTLVVRRICVEISPSLVYEISYSIENTNELRNTVLIYDQIISTLKFFSK